VAVVGRKFCNVKPCTVLLNVYIVTRVLVHKWSFLLCYLGKVAVTMLASYG